MFFCFFDVFADPVLMANLVQHVKHRLVGAAMGGSPQAGDAGGKVVIEIGKY